MQPAGRLILASRSPRRSQLMAKAGLEFEVAPAAEHIETPGVAGEPGLALVARLALAKAADVAGRFADAWVLGADTVAELDDAILGKPADRDDARRMLRALRGREHRVFSGVCLMRRDRSHLQLQVDATRLFMDPVSDPQIETYLDTGQWQGKAGAFGYQDGWEWLHIVSGEASTVVGLPMHVVTAWLSAIAE